MPSRSPHHTCWAAQFAMAAELSRRCYDVAFTVGNAPKYDLFCVAPSGKTFKVQVKGTSKATYGIYLGRNFLTLPTERDLSLAVVVPPAPADEIPFRFFIFSHADAKKQWRTMPSTRRDGRPYTEADPSGLTWGAIKPFENRWTRLPK